jgi:hypothetical protein
VIEFGKPKKLLCEMGKKTRNIFLAKDKKNIKVKPLRMLTYKGETKPLLYWCNLYDVHPNTLYTRIREQWPQDLWFEKPRPLKMPKEELERRRLKGLAKIENRDHRLRVKSAIKKVLEFRCNRMDNMESVHIAIAKVLEMRASRAKRMLCLLDMAA